MVPVITTVHTMPTKIISVSEKQKGWIIGKKGSTIKKIQEESGAVINARIHDDKVHLEGSRMQIDKAESMIQAILSEKDNSVLVIVPKFAVGFVIGKSRKNITDIENETNTTIQHRKFTHFYVKGNPVQQYKAKLKIKETASYCCTLQKISLLKKIPFIYDRQVSCESEFTLKLLEENPHPHWTGQHYRLVSIDKHHLEQERESKDLDELCSQVKDILQSILQREDSENLLVDMWCHYGQAYITKVDEAEENKFYSLQEIKQHLKQKDNPWMASFIEGVQQLDIYNLEKELSHSQTEPYIRCELSILSPTCRQIRLKVFLRASNNGDDVISCNDSPVVVENILEKVSRDDGLVYYLCAPPIHHLKVHIFIPFVRLDCHFVMRTTFRNIVRTPEEEAEDKILIDFLNENLHIKNGNLELPTKQEQLPEDFDLAYWRQSKRRIYSYEGFTIKISEETSENVNDFQTGEDVRTRNDIHVHSKEWDKQFSGFDWQSEHIAQGVPEFLSFVRDVQRLISPEERGEED